MVAAKSADAVQAIENIVKVDLNLPKKKLANYSANLKFSITNVQLIHVHDVHGFS